MKSSKVNQVSSISPLCGLKLHNLRLDYPPTSYPRWIIAPFRTSPTPPTERGCLSFRSPSSSAQSLGGGTAHKQTRPVNNMKDHRETRLRSFLESTAEVGQPLYRLQLSAEERLFKLSFPRVTLLVQSGETLPINRLC